jgi:hypothetical protein
LNLRNGTPVIDRTLEVHVEFVRAIERREHGKTQEAAGLRLEAFPRPNLPERK